MIRVYGSKISYYTGKLETYLRYQGLPYESLPLTPHGRRVRKHVGAIQMPIVELPDGRWMSDSTPIIQHFDQSSARCPVIPVEPVCRFIALLIEDYADEWLWRPAMHYRWSYAHDREFASSFLVDELLTHRNLPRSIKRRLIQRRQRGGFVVGDGVNDATREHVEAGYFTALKNMSRLLESQPFLLGDTPSIADFGLMGPMLRHFGQDPTPAELMRERGPAVYEWVARMWNARASDAKPLWRALDSEDLKPMLQEACETHLVQLRDNAEAFQTGANRFRSEIQGCEYDALPVSRYRVWCLEELRRAFRELSPAEQSEARSLLPHPEAEILWQEEFSPRSNYDPDREAPFNRAINVYGDGVPR